MKIYQLPYSGATLKTFEALGETDKFWKVGMYGGKVGRTEKKSGDFRTYEEARAELIRRRQNQHSSAERHLELASNDLALARALPEYES